MCATGTAIAHPSQPVAAISNLRKVTVVDDLGLLYLMDFTGRIFALDAQQYGPTPFFIDYLSDDVTNDAATFMDAGSLAIDSNGFVYAARNDRIYKYEPAWVNSEGRVLPGDLVGWLGRCDIDLAPGDQAVVRCGQPSLTGLFLHR